MQDRRTIIEEDPVIEAGLEQLRRLGIDARWVTQAEQAEMDERFEADEAAMIERNRDSGRRLARRQRLRRGAPLRHTCRYVARARTAARPRGAGRPRARRVARSSAASGDSGGDEPGEAEPAPEWGRAC